MYEFLQQQQVCRVHHSIVVEVEVGVELAAQGLLQEQDIQGVGDTVEVEVRLIEITGAGWVQRVGVDAKSYNSTFDFINFSKHRE